MPVWGFVVRFVILFAAIFLATSSLDVFTTELGRRRPGTVEMNPLGFLPLHLSILTEIPWLLIGMLLVGFGAWSRRGTLELAKTARFRVFLNDLLRTRYLGMLLLVCPIEVALLRVLAIANNSQELLLEWSVFSYYVMRPLQSATHCSPQFAYVSVFFVIGLIAFIPTVWLVYYVASCGTPEPTAR